jgi:hypothetical protein
MKVKRLLIPFIELPLPRDVILHFNEMDETNPNVIKYQLHPIFGPWILKFGLFLDR